MSVKEIQEKWVATRAHLSKSTIICKVKKRASLTSSFYQKIKTHINPEIAK